ncbi:MAG: hypothetical protein KC589_06560 [Nanoarchaeota archaeon]|nr:hypothetical protein [Nanoarchaeota archaeon]
MKEKNNQTLNPLIKQIKIQKGFIDEVSLRNETHIDFLIQTLLYSYKDKKYNNQKIKDYNPILLPLVVNDTGNNYFLFKHNNKSPIKSEGIYGINLNLLISENSEINIELNNIRNKIYILYITYLHSISIYQKENIIDNLNTLVNTLFELKQTKNTFIQTPFVFYERKYILFLENIKSQKYINQLMSFHQINNNQTNKGNS